MSLAGPVSLLTLKVMTPFNRGEVGEVVEAGKGGEVVELVEGFEALEPVDAGEVVTFSESEEAGKVLTNRKTRQANLEELLWKVVICVIARCGISL